MSFGEKFGNPNESNKKKSMHREIERQRRQEMANLHQSLRSLLPSEYLKGKRSITDHMHEAVKYIKYLENNIQELREKRDVEVMKSSSNCGKEYGQQSSPQDMVSVKCCWIGIELLINTSISKGLPLSRVLQLLNKQGLNVVSCISTLVNQTRLFTIQSQVSEGRSIDLHTLQQNITNLATKFHG